MQPAPDAFRGLVDAGDVVVEFGQQGAAGVVGSTRLVLPVETARRLAARLGDVLVHMAPEALAEDAPRRGTTPVNAPPDPAAERAALTLRLVGGLGAPRNHERSFRVVRGALMANRFLLSLNADDIPGSPRTRVLEVCERLGMPAALRAQAEDSFAMASCIHFGFEEGGSGTLAKLYLERAIGEDEKRQAQASGAPVLLHLAFKWSDQGAGVVSRYWLHPGSPPEGMEARLARLYAGTTAAPSLEIALAVLRLAVARGTPGGLQYLEVTEDGNPRRSFDLNVYDAGLSLKDAQAALFTMRDRFGVRPGQFQALYDQVRDSRFGHLAGGVHRDGADFFNVYYGVSGLPRLVGGAT